MTGDIAEKILNKLEMLHKEFNSKGIDKHGQAELDFQQFSHSTNESEASVASGS